MREIAAERETYIYSAASTTVVFALFDGILGHYADRLAQLATTNPLTGLFNARAFHERLRQELGRSVRYREPLSLLIVFASEVIGLDRYPATTNRSSTFVAPGPAHAARSASSRSAELRGPIRSLRPTRTRAGKKVAIVRAAPYAA